MKMINAVLCFALLSAMESSSDAAIIASFTPDNSAFTPLAIGVGDTTDVPLYLRYDGIGTNYLSSPGLLSAGIGVSFFPTGVANASFLSLGSGWDPGLSGETIDNSLGSAILQTTVNFGDPAVVGVNSILLGTLRFTGVSGGTTVLTLGDAVPGPGNDDTLIDDGSGTILDDIIQFGATATITVNGTAAVPEPGSGIALLVGAGLWGWRRRKRMQKWRRGE
jgi:hypothetical protein